MKKLLLFSLIFAQSALAFDEALYQEVLKDTQAHTKTLSRPLLVYHRFFNDSLKQMPANDPYWLNSVVKYRGPKYFGTETSNDKFGPGIYAAVDPTSSTPFGKLVAEIEIAAGTLFLDVRSGTEDTEDGFKIRKSTFEKLIQVCTPFKPINELPYFQNGEQWVSVYKPDVFKSALCRQYFNQAFADLKIQFIVYEWYSPQSEKEYSPCSANSANAFVVTGLLQNDQRSGENVSNINFDSFTVRGFSPSYQFSQTFSEDLETRKAEKLALLANPESDFARYMFMNDFMRISDSGHLGHDQWSVFNDIIEKPGRKESLELIKRSRFRCDRAVYTEDKSPVYTNKKK